MNDESVAHRHDTALDDLRKAIVPFHTLDYPGHDLLYMLLLSLHLTLDYPRILLMKSRYHRNPTHNLLWYYILQLLYLVVYRSLLCCHITYTRCLCLS